MSSTLRTCKRWSGGPLSLVAAAIVCVLLVVAPASGASASTYVGSVRVNAAEARLFRLVNAQRAHSGLPALRLAAGYTDVARRWSRAMAARRTLVHNPRLSASVSRAGGSTWRVVGENVAYGYRPDIIFSMYMRSPPHRANILGRSYRYIGVGWVESSAGGPGYTTLVFANTYSSSYGGSRVAAAPCRLYR